MDNILKFDVDELRKRRILRASAQAIELDPIAPGEVALGQCTSDEVQLFTEMVSVYTEIQAFDRELTAREFDNMSKRLRDIGTTYNPQQDAPGNRFVSVEEEEEYAELNSRLAYIREMLFYSLRSKYGFRFGYGVRAGFVVVRTVQRA